jgi:DNA-directed RNA polymerase specialized sigma24 family protein
VAVAVRLQGQQDWRATLSGGQNRCDAHEQDLEYAPLRDFPELFTRNMNELRTLAFLITGDQTRAEQCFVAGLEESTGGNPVFKEWARAWSKRVIIRNAIKMMTPTPGQRNLEPANRETRRNSCERDALLDLLLELAPFERFVFVIWVLEGYSLSDTASLLGCTVTELSRARSQALRQIALARSGSRRLERDLSSLSHAILRQT